MTSAAAPVLLSLEDRPKLLTELRPIGVAVNVDSMHGGSTNDLLFLPADRESATGVTWHVSTINDLAWHPYLLYWACGGLRLCGR